MSDKSRLLAAIEALQAQRALLGDAVVDTALAPLQAELARLQAPVQHLRQVSVLFLDVVGSTALSQRLDPEEVSAVMDGVLARGSEVVVAHRGRVLQYAGDNLLAAFGTERAEEDDAERAVHCGLALLDEGRRLGERVLRDFGQAGCNVRVGIHTGAVLLGGGVDQEGTIRGMTVNIAARMEQTAPHGALRISHDTWLQVRGAFVCEAQPPLQVKGRDEALLTYLVDRARPPAERVLARGLEGVAAPLTGRDAELATLLEGRDAALRDRCAQPFTLIGEAGLGKSRLLAELRARLAGPTHAWWLLQARSHPQTRLQPYGLLRDLVARQLQLADSDALEVVRQRLQDGLRAWLGDKDGEPALARVHRLGQLLGIDFSDSTHVQSHSPMQLRRSGLGALADWLRALAAPPRALALLLEDLHWADDASLDALEDVLGGLDAVPMLVVATARPELLEARPAWGDSVPGHRRVVLGALDAEAGKRLAGELLQRLRDGAGRERVLELLLQRSGGNPYYMEELLRMLRDDGVIVDAAGGDGAGAGAGADWSLQADRLDPGRLPSTLVGVLQARLDHLSADERAALQQASIVGPVFWDEALAALDARSPVQLPMLRQRSLVHRRSQSTFEGAAEEAFSHHLLQQVTYDTVLKSARLAGHAAAAAWLAQRVGQRASEYLAITADHYERAGDHVRAYEFLTRAARAAAERFANATAIEYTDRALANPVVAADPRKRMAMFEQRTWVFDVMGRRAEQQQAQDAWEAIARELGDDALLADVLMAQALLASRRSDEARSLVLAEQAMEAAERGGNLAAAAHAMGQVAWVRHTQGRAAEALALARTALARIQASPDDGSVKNRALFELQLTALLGIAELAAGRPAAALRTLQQGLSLARRQGNPRSQTHLIEQMSTIARHCGRHAESLALDRENIRLCEGMGLVTSLAWAHYQAGCNEKDLGQRAEARVDFQRAEALALQSEDRRLQGLAIARQALIEPSRAQALALFDKARGLLDGEATRREALRLLTWRTSAALDAGELQDAVHGAGEIDQYLQQGHAPDEDDSQVLPLWTCHRVWSACGRAAEAADALQQSYRRLLAWVEGMDDEDMRRDALHRVPLHREIVAAWEAANAGLGGAGR